MKQRSKPDHDSVVSITKKYVDATNRISEIIFNPKETSLHYAQKKIDAVLIDTQKSLTKANKTFTQNELKSAYAEGKLKSQNIINDSQAHAPIILSGNGMVNSEDTRYRDIRRGAFIELNDGLKNATDKLRQQVKQTIRGLDDRNRNLNEFTQAIKKALANENILEVTYKNGSKISLDHYAKMLSRSSRIETANLGGFQRATELGSDLVKCTTISPTCELCASYQGRVYSISGNDKRFPALYETALKNGYLLMHPNCRHEFLPYFEQLQSKTGFEQDKAFSARQFKDSRTLQERDNYAKWQGMNRQLNNEKSEYVSMQKVLGEDMPYKTLGGFRRAKRGYNELKKTIDVDNRDKIEYNNYNTARIACKDVKLQSEIKLTYPKKIEPGKQGKHLEGNNNYTDGKSKLNITLEEAQELVDKYSGSGKVQRTRDGRWLHQENIILDRPIGLVKNNLGKWVATNRFKIHYSKKGTHIVPTLKEDRRNDRK